MEALPIVVFWGLAIWAFFQKKQALIYLFFASMSFGSFAVIPTELTKGLTFTATPIVALLLITKQIAATKGVTNVLNNAFDPRGLLLLFLFWVLAAVTTAFMPRFFENVIQVVPVRLGDSTDTTPLVPTVQNLSQFVYISISVMTVFVFADLLRSPSMQKHAVAALCLGAGVAVFTGLIDFASQYLPLKPALEVFRTASYALLTDVEVLNAKRVVGLMPEASSFGTLTLSFLASVYFFRHAAPPGPMRSYVMPSLVILLMLLVWMSTSSAAFLGLALFGLLIVCDWVWRATFRRTNPYLRLGLMNDFWIAISILTIALMTLVVIPQLLSPLIELVDETVFKKSGTSSFEERSMWTRVSWQALMGTYGLGVGLGATRASNFLVALISNVGVLGGICYLLFLSTILIVKRVPAANPQRAAWLLAIRWTYLPPFFISLTIGTTADFGMFNAFLFGFAVAICKPTIGLKKKRRYSHDNVDTALRPAA